MAFQAVNSGPNPGGGTFVQLITPTLFKYEKSGGNYMDEEEIYDQYHNNIAKAVENALEGIKKLPNENAELILDFFQRYYSINDCSPTRHTAVLSRLKLIALRHGKRIDDVNLEEFQRFFARMKEEGYHVTKTVNGKQTLFKKGKYKGLEDYVKVWRMYLRFLDADKEPRNRKYSRILEAKLNLGKKKKGTVGIKKELLLNEDEAIRFRNAAEKRGVHVFVMTMVGMELGCRKETIGQALVKQCTFNKDKQTGRIISFDLDTIGKTGSQHWHGVQTAGLLFNWVTKHHPLRGTQNFNSSPLFVSQRGLVWTSANITREIKIICRAAKISEEKARPHWIFRHRRASFLFAKYPTAVATKLMNFVGDSRVALRTYFHFSQKQGDELIDAENGLKEKKEIKDLDVLPICPVCNVKAQNLNQTVCQNLVEGKICNMPIGKGLIKILDEHRLTLEEKDEVKDLKKRLENMEQNFVNVLKHYEGEKIIVKTR